MKYLVKITTKLNSTTFVEYAGLRGVRSLDSAENGKGRVIESGTVKGRKLEAWKTVGGAERYIKGEQELDEKRIALGAKWTRTYEIISL